MVLKHIFRRKTKPLPPPSPSSKPTPLGEAKERYRQIVERICNATDMEFAEVSMRILNGDTPEEILLDHAVLQRKRLDVLTAQFHEVCGLRDSTQPGV